MIQRVLGVVSGVLKTLYRIPYAKRPLDLTLTWTAAAVRLGNGTFCGVGQSVQPEKTLILYEYEGCPFCKKVSTC
ncbi:hypothetical protein SARC_16114 [Sphaeroforma arctica JP610]|uniref:Glutaredoxin domain-containing protein n=1 Tax=Sphaeroforma arctica JP610 TaxID=667725 RepID=A0A0L0F3P2_9EUKA|nr:hypothetical protein SARC_16114 [Sphaeroforma arctica JP610]KNC71350.1 hypothetical protein SARC_16114 [Sphaeroforma arctica JP610]|eukprot:XP_014145252.1 hypothetical protein SARC_16114 [Sphaeroforma arctica JP610]